MSWYQVVKTINGRKYLYLQMTYREGRKVKTKNKYIGPATGGFGGGAPAVLPTATEGKPIATKRQSKPLKLDPIVRWNDLTKDQQKAQLQKSKRLRAADARRQFRAEFSDDEWKDYLEKQKYEREKRRELRKLEKKKSPPQPTLLQKISLFKWSKKKGDA